MGHDCHAVDLDRGHHPLDPGVEHVVVEILHERERRVHVLVLIHLPVSVAVEIRHLTGEDLTEDVWDVFWQFYQDTGARKWGTPYLTREAFTLLGQRMGERILLIIAFSSLVSCSIISFLLTV